MLTAVEFRISCLDPSYPELTLLSKQRTSREATPESVSSQELVTGLHLEPFKSSPNSEPLFPYSDTEYLTGSPP
jgi:hypothetical protein